MLGRLNGRRTSAPPSALYCPTPADKLVLRSAVRSWGVPRFCNWPLLLRALTHTQVSNWAAMRLAVPPASLSPSQLEFLGDRVIGAALVANGHSAVRDIVGNAGLALAARRAGIDRLLRCREGSAESKATLSDAFEAVAGALYLDGGIAAAQSFVETTLMRNEADVRNVNKDFNRLKIELSAAVKATLGPDAVLIGKEYAILNGVVTEDMEGGGAKKYGHRLSVSHVPPRPSLGRHGSRNRADETTILADVVAASRLGAMCGSFEEALEQLQRWRDEDATLSKHTEGHYALDLDRANSETGQFALRAVLFARDSVDGIVDASFVDRCLRASKEGPGANISGAMISATLQTWVASLASREAFREAAEVGHYVLQLCFAEASFRAAPQAPRNVLTTHLESTYANRYEVARCMGGVISSGMDKLVMKVHGRMMIYVAIGVVARTHGFKAALQWAEGGLKVQSAAKRR